MLIPDCPRVHRAWLQRSQLKYDQPLSYFAFNFNMWRYAMLDIIETTPDLSDLAKAISDLPKLRAAGHVCCISTCTSNSVREMQCSQFSSSG
jgi:hypothetical protein